MTKAVPFAGVLVVLAIGGWLFAQQSKTAGPTSSVVTQAESQALDVTAATNFSQAVPALQARYAQTGSYVGAQLPAESGVTLVTASSTSYCIQSNVAGTEMHEDGPGDSVQNGSC